MNVSQLNYLTSGAQIPNFRSLSMQFIVILPVPRNFKVICNFWDNLWTAGPQVFVRNTAAGYNIKISRLYCSYEINKD
jgi:hypothetical protein